MDTKLCRICGKLGQTHVSIFKTEGLKNKIETCLPIIVSPHSLLPDTICGECSENVDNFYSFIKNCLQNIIILEAQYDITESCLKTKRKHDKGCVADLALKKVSSKALQTDNYLDRLLNENEELIHTFPLHPRVALFENEQQHNHHNNNNNNNNNNKRNLVDYDIDSDTASDTDENCGGRVYLTGTNNKLKTLFSSKLLTKQYFDDTENYLINEIAQRKSLKRSAGGFIETRKPKIFKVDSSNRRKSRQPKKCERTIDERGGGGGGGGDELTFGGLERIYEEMENGGYVAGIERNHSNILDMQIEKDLNSFLPQVCLLCDEQFSGPSMLTSHVFETHGIDMAQIVSQYAAANSDNNSTMERKKKLPNLLKISDLKRNDSFDDNQIEQQVPEDPPTLLPSFVCPLCPAVFTARPELFAHLRIKHPDQSTLLCGMCLHQANSFINLRNHIDVCSQQHQIVTRYICKICRYGDDNSKALENHVLVHDFLLDACKKQAKMFDPADYIENNDNYETNNTSSNSKNLCCNECGLEEFDSFKEFSAHRRSQHSIFHCDLCNKFYGRNSHLWKHVNRLHKGHPSITCQVCYKTSASKYHLAQHFNKIHSTKSFKQKSEPLLSSMIDTSDDFMSQKFQAFDFQSVKQSFMRQELLEQEKKLVSDDNSNQRLSDDEDEQKFAMPKAEPACAPKEIDSSSDLYTNIITNYTPPANEGEFKCPKCGKGFHKKTLLKKHKKNCRPRLQKDLLTRCKSCARIFKDRQSLAKHLVNYHSEYACEICGQKVQSKCEIVSHIRFSHPGCHLFCTICGNILRSRNDLLEHTHDHSNSYVCQFCADALPSKIKLKMHILSLHRKILSLSCGVCLKLFETQHVLRDHVRLVHRDQLAPLTSCPVCGKNYGSKWKTYDHLNKSHGRIFKACKTCLEIFDTDTQLQAHCEAVHNNQNSTTSTIRNCLVPQMPQLTTVNNDGNCETDSERDDQNSEQSDGDGDINQDNNKKSDSEEQECSQYDMKDGKISLLEKRLLGKKIINNDEQQLKKIAQHKDEKNKIQLKAKDLNKKKSSEQLKREDEQQQQQQQLDNIINNSPNPQHNSSKRTVYVNSNDPSYCEICLKTWPAKKHLWQHYIRCHKSVAATVCGICLKTNSSYSNLQQHLRETHPTLLHGQGFGSNFICRICGRYHNASSKLKLHMAIHENFDWSLLEEKKTESINEVKEKSNGYEDEKRNNDDDEEEEEEEEEGEGGMYEENEDINYESLIEQVECSSVSENESSDVDNGHNVEEKHKSSSDDDDDDDDEEEEEEEEEDDGDGDGEEEEDDDDDDDDSESCTSENSLETQMLHNMLREKQIQNNIKEEYSSTEESSESLGEESFTIKSENSSDEDLSQVDSVSSHGNKSNSNESVNMFHPKSEEIDSAVQSIKYEYIEKENVEIDNEYCEMQTSTLNDNEIESAVGSIL